MVSQAPPQSVWTALADAVATSVTDAPSGYVPPSGDTEPGPYTCTVSVRVSVRSAAHAPQPSSAYPAPQAKAAVAVLSASIVSAHSDPAAVPPQAPPQSVWTALADAVATSVTDAPSGYVPPSGDTEPGPDTRTVSVRAAAHASPPWLVSPAGHAEQPLALPVRCVSLVHATHRVLDAFGTWWSAHAVQPAASSTSSGAVHIGPSTSRSSVAVADRPRESVAIAVIACVSGDAVTGAATVNERVGSGADGTLQPVSSSHAGASSSADA